MLKLNATQFNDTWISKAPCTFPSKQKNPTYLGFFCGKVTPYLMHLSYMTHSSHKGSHEIVPFFVRLCQ